MPFVVLNGSVFKHEVYGSYEQKSSYKAVKLLENQAVFPCLDAEKHF